MLTKGECLLIRIKATNHLVFLLFRCHVEKYIGLIKRHKNIHFMLRLPLLPFLSLILHAPSKSKMNFSDLAALFQGTEMILTAFRGALS